MAGVGNMKQVVLEKYTSGKSGTGSTQATLTDSYAIWAEAVNSGGGRSYQANQTQLTESLRFNIFWRDRFDVTAIWKIIYDGRRHNVSNVRKVDEKKFNYQITADSKGGV